MWTTIRSYMASKPVVFMNTTTSYSYDSSLMPGCEVTAQGLACPTASHAVKVVPNGAPQEAMAPQMMGAPQMYQQ